jgi:hypothetical protein
MLCNLSPEYILEVPEEFSVTRKEEFLSSSNSSVNIRELAPTLLDWCRGAATLPVCQGDLDAVSLAVQR